MTFINKKEEVINIELTQYGKFLLSKGKFKPAYYSFFDDDIVYDSQYAGFQETQADIQTRIKETPRVKPQYTFSGAETQMKRNVELVRSEKEKNAFADRFLQTAEKHYSLSAPLGNSDLASDKIPCWKVNFLKGEISKTIKHTTGSHPTLVIPQITVMPITYQTIPVKEGQPEIIEFQDKGESGGISDLNLASKRFADGTFIQIKDDYVLIDIKEENVQFKNDNFDVEVYLIDRDSRRDGTNSENLIPLYFPKEKQEVVNGILLDDVEEKMNTMLGPSFVNHFFNVFVDKEINPKTLCKLLSEEEIIALNNSGEYYFDCADKQTQELQSAKLKSDVTPEDIEEKC